MDMRRGMEYNDHYSHPSAIESNRRLLLNIGRARTNGISAVGGLSPTFYDLST
jgi:hypothetical protein